MNKSLFILTICIFTSFTSLGQEANEDRVFEVAKVGFDKTENPDFLNFYIKVLESNNHVRLLHKDLEIIEQVNGKRGSTQVTINRTIDYTPVMKIDTSSQENFSVYFLLENNGFMVDDWNQSKNMVNDIVRQLSLSGDSKYWVGFYGDTYRNSEEMTAVEVPDYLEGTGAEESSADFYHALVESVRFFKRKPGKKLFFILGSGNNVIDKNPAYGLRLPEEEDDVFRQLKELPLDFYIFPVGMGNEIQEGFLKKLPENTGNPDDSYQKGSLPAVFSTLLKETKTLVSNNLIKVIPGESTFQGYDRRYTVKWKRHNVEVEFLFQDENTPTSPVVIGRQVDTSQLLLLFFIGLTVIGAFLVLSLFLVPFFRERHFRKNFVHPYVPEPNMRRVDVLTGQTIEAGELVVNKCRQLTPLASWNDLGQCPNYPECLNYESPCDGSGAPVGSNNFFSMQGVFRNLNWMWFGMCGGFLSWVIFVLFKQFDFTWYRNLIGSFFDSLSEQISATVLRTLADDTIVGVAMGIGLIAMLSLVEERGQARKISWGRILIRMFTGALMAIVVFSIGFLLQYNHIIPGGYFRGLVAWLLFGAGTGLVLSIKSSVMVKRGVIGGLIASLLAYHVYFPVSGWIENFVFGKLVSLMLLGAVLGITLVTVITTLEDFELEYITPKTFQSIVPVSKWLKAGLEVFIGTDSGSYVYVKWNDGSVQPQHAKLFLLNSNVFLRPLGETLVNGRVIPFEKNTQLKNNDIIQLGQHSITSMRYREKTRPVRSTDTGEHSPAGSSKPETGDSDKAISSKQINGKKMFPENR